MRDDERGTLIPVTAQPLDIEDGDTAIFQPEQALFLQPVQRAVSILAGHARERTDLLLGDLEMRGGFRIEDGIEQRGDAAGEPRSGTQCAVALEHPDELAEPLVELA